MKPGQNPCGVFIQAQGMGGGEMQSTVDHIAAANYSTVSIMDNFELCVRVKDRVPDCDVVYRDSEFEPSPAADNKKVIGEWFRKKPDVQRDRRIRLMVNCENGFSADRVKMAVDQIQAADTEGRTLCVMNVGAGTVKSGQLRGDGSREENQWLTIGAPLLECLSARPHQVLGVHNYTSVFAWIVSNGTYSFGSHQVKPKIDWKLAQWHLGRELQGIVEACSPKNLDLDLASMMITECWVDQMNDIQNNPGNPYHAIQSSRWRNLIPVWGGMYPGRHAEDVLADQLYWQWENIFAVYGNVIGMHFFTWLSTALSQGIWRDDDVANAPTFLKRQVAYRPDVIAQPPPTEPEEPTDPKPPTDRELLLQIQQQLDIVDRNVTQLTAPIEAAKQASAKARDLLNKLDLTNKENHDE